MISYKTVLVKATQVTQEQWSTSNWEHYTMLIRVILPTPAAYRQNPPASSRSLRTMKTRKTPKISRLLTSTIPTTTKGPSPLMPVPQSLWVLSLLPLPSPPPHHRCPQQSPLRSWWGEEDQASGTPPTGCPFLWPIHSPILSLILIQWMVHRLHPLLNVLVRLKRNPSVRFLALFLPFFSFENICYPLQAFVHILSNVLTVSVSYCMHICFIYIT